MKLIIAGSRGFSDKRLLFEKLDKLTAKTKITEVVSGGARGADKLGEEWAKKRKIPIKQFIPHWDILGKGAGFLRNEDMGRYADLLVAFWDGESRGTKHMIDFMKEKKKPYRVIRYG